MTSLKTWRELAVAALVAGSFCSAAVAADPGNKEQVRSEMQQLPWQHGPADAAVGQKASLHVPERGGLLPESSGSRFLELTGNLPETGNTDLVNGNWWATFAFNESGYIKDDEKLDAAELLESMRKGQDEQNAERRKRGMDELFIDGWAVAPHYDPATKYLEWGTKLHSSRGGPAVVNYSMRLLSRRGYETVVLVTDAGTLDHDVQELRGILKGFSFNAGEGYAEFRPGDHVAEFGLGALVLGGAAAAAVKAGWFKGLLAALAAGWKLVAASVVAGGAGLKRLFGRKSA